MRTVSRTRAGMSRLAIFLAVVVALLASSAVVATAQEEQRLDGKIRMGDQVGVATGDTVDGDLYVFAGNVAVDGEVTGDVVVFGGQVRLGGRIGGDVIAAAGNLDVSGPVDGDVRVSGGVIQLRADVAEDVLVAGGQVTVGGNVGGDLIFAAGQVDLTGSVAGDVLGRSGSYERTGSVGGTEDVTIDRDEPPDDRRSPFARAVGLYASVMLAGLLAAVIHRGRRLGITIGVLREQPGWAAVWGLVFLVALVVVPVGTLLVGGLAAALLAWLGVGQLAAAVILAVLAVWAVLAVVAFVAIVLLAPVTVGTWLAGLVLPDSTPTVLAMGLGVAVLVALGFVPVAGPLVGLAVTVLGVGAWIRALRPPRQPSAGPALSNP